MAFIRSCCLCCNLRTGSFISGIYCVIATIFYLILLIIRNVGYDLVQKYDVHAVLTYAGIGILSLFTMASVLLVIGVPLDKSQLYVMWSFMAPVTITFSTVSLCFIIVYDLQNDIPIEGWEEALIGVHAVNFVLMVACMICVYSQVYDLSRGMGTAEYYRTMEIAREQALAVMFGLDMGLTEDEALGVSGPMGRLEPPDYLGVPPPAYSDLSSRRTLQREQNNQGESAGNTTSGDAERPANQRPVSNPATGNNTPTSTVRSHDSGMTPRSRPRPSPTRAPPSDTDSLATTIPRDTTRGTSSLCYLNFDPESEDGLSTLRSQQAPPGGATTTTPAEGATEAEHPPIPTTLVRNEGVARIMVDNSGNGSGNVGNGSSNRTGNNRSDSSTGGNRGGNSSTNQRPGSETGSGSSHESRSRSRIREGATGGHHGNSNSTSTSGNQGRPNRPPRGNSNRENQDGGRSQNGGQAASTNQEQPNRRRSSRTRQNAPVELPPPYQTIDPNIRRSSRDRNEARGYAHALMRQRSRDRYPDAMDPRIDMRNDPALMADHIMRGGVFP